LDELIAEGVLEPIQNPRWSTPVVPIIKDTGKIRLCGDYKVTVNTALDAHLYPVPATDRLLTEIKPGGFFARIDMAQAYLQFPVDEASAEAQTIVTHRGTFKVNRLQFGVNIAPNIFQAMMDDLLAGLPGVVPYFDDILISASSRESLTEVTREVFRRLLQVVGGKEDGYDDGRIYYSSFTRNIRNTWTLRLYRLR